MNGRLPFQPTVTTKKKKEFQTANNIIKLGPIGQD